MSIDHPEFPPNPHIIRAEVGAIFLACYVVCGGVCRYVQLDCYFVVMHLYFVVVLLFFCAVILWSCCCVTLVDIVLAVIIVVVVVVDGMLFCCCITCCVYVRAASARNWLGSGAVPWQHVTNPGLLFGPCEECVQL